MGGALGSASAVVLNTPEAERAVRAALPELADRLVTIPNGWDAEDFSGTPARRGAHEPFRITHTGYVHDAPSGSSVARTLRRLLGGETPGLVTEARSARFLLEAVRRVVDGGSPRSIEVHLAGPAPTRTAAADGSFVVDHGYLSHADALALLCTSDLLFLPMHDLAADLRSRTVPGKTYEYLASGTPVLAALPAGDARDLLSGVPNVWLCAPRAVECMADAIRAALHTAPVERVTPPIASSYERAALAGRLAEVLDGVVSAAGHSRTHPTTVSPR
jgi:glycosyltransferase involved in cell wall biosynthesis